MLYGINENLEIDGHWILINGWFGCQLGQGTVVERDLSYDEIKLKLNKAKDN